MCKGICSIIDVDPAAPIRGVGIIGDGLAGIGPAAAGAAAAYAGGWIPRRH